MNKPSSAASIPRLADASPRTHRVQYTTLCLFLMSRERSITRGEGEYYILRAGAFLYSFIPEKL